MRGRGSEREREREREREVHTCRGGDLTVRNSDNVPSSSQDLHVAGTHTHSLSHDTLAGVTVFSKSQPCFCLPALANAH